jgi:hypothetical protein
MGCGFGWNQLHLGIRIRRRMSWPTGCPPCRCRSAFAG